MHPRWLYSRCARFWRCSRRPCAKRLPLVVAFLLLVAVGFVATPFARPALSNLPPHNPSTQVLPFSGPSSQDPVALEAQKPTDSSLPSTVQESPPLAQIEKSHTTQAAFPLPRVEESHDTGTSFPLAATSGSSLPLPHPLTSVPLPQPRSLHRHQAHISLLEATSESPQKSLSTLQLPHPTHLSWQKHQAQVTPPEPDNYPSTPASSLLPFPLPEAFHSEPLSLTSLPTDNDTPSTHSLLETNPSVFSPPIPPAAQGTLLLPDPSTPSSSLSYSDRIFIVPHNPLRSLESSSTMPAPNLDPTSTMPTPNLDPTNSPPPASVRTPVNVFFRGEFGYELIAALPFAYWHYLNGSLNSTRFCAMPSLALLYYFSPIQTVGWKCKRSAHFNFVIKRYGFKEGLHDSEIPDTWTAPPLASHIRELGPVWTDVPMGASLVVISNKFETEWGEPPINFIDIPTLKRIITEFLNSGYYVVYNRAGKAFRTDREQRDLTGLGEYRMFREEFWLQPRFTTMHKLRRSCPGCDYNEVQFRTMARSSCFISVQGGTSVLSSYWGGRNIIYFRRGAEEAGRAYERIYPRLSGCQIDVVRSYDALTTKVEEMIRDGRCQAV